MSEKQFEELAHKLDTLIKLTAYNLLKGISTKTQKIGILISLGLRKKEIALIVGTTEGSVETIKKRLEKRAKKKKAKPKEKLKQGRLKQNDE